MQHTRVLGTIGLVAATVFSAIGPGTTSHAATTKPTIKVTRVSTAAAVTKLHTALQTGYVVSPNGHHIPLSSALRNFVSSGQAVSKINTTVKARAAAAGHADASTPPTIAGSNRQANQDFGYYDTGNGQLFHNTESVAVDPLSSAHVVVGATDTRVGSEGSNFNFGSNPSPSPFQNGAGNATSCTDAQTFTGGLPFGCDLIEALGGPGVYNSTDSGSTFTDLIIPDMLSGAVPDAISAFVPPPPPVTRVPGVVTNAAPSPSIPGTAVACLSNTLALTNTINTPGTPNGCVPYDSAGDQSVAFDSLGNLYSATLGVVNTPPGVGVSIPQTDVVINVSPAVQPIGASALQAVLQTGIGPSTTGSPNAAGRFFNAPPASPTCNPFQSSTTLCLHNEVTASNSPTNFIATSDMSPTITFSNTIGMTASVPLTGNSSITATIVGRNYQADANNPAVGAFGNGACGISDVCLIDSPYLVIDDNVNTAYLTFTVIDFNTSTSNIYLQTSNLLGNPGQGQLPFWSAPVLVDNGFANGNCLFGFCTASWGAEPTVGADGALYIAYENGDLFTFSPIPLNQILVAFQYAGTPSIVQGTIAAGTVEDHDVYNYTACSSSLGTPAAICNNPAGLDPASGAYFTIPNRPSIAVTNTIATTTVGTVSSGVITVVWTDQGSFGSGASGTRVVYTEFALNETPTAGNLIPITSPTLLSPQAGTVNQFFPWVTASQSYFGTLSRSLKDAIFVGYYQETPGTVTYSADGSTQSSTATLNYVVAKSNDAGATFGTRTVDNTMPLPNPPSSAAYYDYFVGNTIPGSYTSTQAETEFSIGNAVPYFGTYTGAASDHGNGAYLSWTSTRGVLHDFNVGGSQNVNVVHVS